MPGSMPAVYTMRAAVRRHLLAIEREDKEGHGPKERAEEREAMLEDLKKFQKDPAVKPDDELDNKEINKWRRLVTSTIWNFLPPSSFKDSSSSP